MKLIAYEELIAAPWKNGGGVTRELACHPANASLNAFAWRVSIADVASSGPFSSFPGIDRIITLLDGDGMHLHFAHGGEHALTTTLQPYRFRGEDSLNAQLLGSPSRDFNLMLQRDAARGEIDARRTGGTLSGISSDGEHTTLLLFCAAGNWRVTGLDGVAQTIGRNDSVLIENPVGETAVAPLQAECTLLCVRITLLQAIQ